VLVVEKNGDVCFSRALSIHGRQLTRQLSQTLKITETEAENLKRRHGLELWAPGREASSLTDEERKSPAGQVYLSLISPLENLVVDLEHSFKHFSYQVTQSQIQRFDRLVLSGGGANLRHLDRFFAERLGVPVERLDVLASMRVNATARSSRKDFPNDSAVFAPALGVSLTSLSEKAKYLNMAAPVKRPSKGPSGAPLLRLKASHVLVLAVAVMAALAAPQVIRLRNAREQSASLAAQVKTARAKMTEMQERQLALAQREKEIAESNNVLEEKIRQFRMAGREKKQFSSILAKLAEVLPAEIWINQLSYEERRLTIVGGATKTELVAGVIDSLKKPEDFSDVTFHYTQRDETTSTYKFEITMNVR
jgi:cell division ATPase FtsA